MNVVYVAEAESLHGDCDCDGNVRRCGVCGGGGTLGCTDASADMSHV